MDLMDLEDKAAEARNQNEQLAERAKVRTGEWGGGQPLNRTGRTVYSVF